MKCLNLPKENKMMKNCFERIKWKNTSILDEIFSNLLDMVMMMILSKRNTLGKWSIVPTSKGTKPLETKVKMIPWPGFNWKWVERYPVHQSGLEPDQVCEERHGSWLTKPQSGDMGWVEKWVCKERMNTLPTFNTDQLIQQKTWFLDPLFH
jgi:hypothetical protein